jgi:hypothetical protein
MNVSPFIPHCHAAGHRGGRRLDVLAHPKGVWQSAFFRLIFLRAQENQRAQETAPPGAAMGPELFTG